LVTANRPSPSHEEAEEEFRRRLIQRQSEGTIDDHALQYFSRVLEDRSTLNVTLKFVRNLAHGAQVLDLGCGMGSFEVELCKSSKYECIGLELDKSFVRLAALRLKLHGYRNASFVLGDIRALPFRGRTFKIVVLHDVASVANLKDLLGEISRAIRTSGIFVFDAPLAKFYRLFPAQKSFRKYSKSDITDALGRKKFVIEHALLTGMPPILQERYHLPVTLLRGVSRLVTSLPSKLQELLSQFWYDVLFVAKYG
jgi:SAM-dependent methyltransferase